MIHRTDLISLTTRTQIETPQTAPEMIWFQEELYHELAPPEMRLRWDKTNLTVDETAKVRISVWGYREDTVNPKLEYIDMLVVRTKNFCLLKNSLSHVTF